MIWLYQTIKICLTAHNKINATKFGLFFFEFKTVTYNNYRIAEFLT